MNFIMIRNLSYFRESDNRIAEKNLKYLWTILATVAAIFIPTGQHRGELDDQMSRSRRQEEPHFPYGPLTTIVSEQNDSIKVNMWAYRGGVKSIKLATTKSQ
jgi:hypothetical protein